MTSPLRICELFAGIGATAQGLRDLGIPFESTVCEIDPGAYDAVRGLGFSDTVMYRLAGNSIAVPCLTAIYRSLRDAGLLRGGPGIHGPRKRLYTKNLYGRLWESSEKPIRQNRTQQGVKEMAYWTYIYAQADRPAYYLGTIRNASGRITDLLDMLGLDGEGISDLVRRKGWDGFDLDAVHVVEGDPDGLEQGDEIPMCRVILDTEDGLRYIEVPDIGESLWDVITLYDDINGTEILDDYDVKHIVVEDAPGQFCCPPYDGEPQHGDEDDEEAA